MTKSGLKRLVREYGDVIITFRSLNSNRLKYNVCTTDFDCEYIQQKKNKAVEDEDTLLMFCWDTDTFRLIRPSKVTDVIPLSVALGVEFYNGFDDKQ